MAWGQQERLQIQSYSPAVSNLDPIAMAFEEQDIQSSRPLKSRKSEQDGEPMASEHAFTKQTQCEVG